MTGGPLAALRRRQDYLPPPRAEGAGGAQVASSTVWSGLGIGANAMLQIVRSMIFARLLMPEDFGILGLANIFTQFVLIFANFGFGQSLIYHQELDRKDIATCWWGNLAVDSTTALVCVGFAMLSSRFSHDPTVAWVVCLLAIQFVVTSVGSTNNALMRRRFMFKHIALATFAGGVVSFAAAWSLVATTGWGVYGLVVGMIAGSATITALNLVFMPWLPSFRFSRESLKKHFRYGRWILGVNLVTYANGNLDRTLVGTLLSKAQLGFYDYAGNIPLMLVNMLGQVLNTVLFSAFSSLQDKQDELRSLLLKVYRYNAVLVFPILVGIALVAPDFILVAYGEKWLPIVTPLRLFALVGVLQLYTRPLYILCNSQGLPNLPFRWSLIYLPINMGLLYLGVILGGTAGVVAARLVMPVFMALTLGIQIMRVVGTSWPPILRSTLPALAGSAVMAVAVRALFAAGIGLPDGALLRLLVQVGVGAGAYLLFIAAVMRGELTDMIAFLRRRS